MVNMKYCNGLLTSMSVCFFVFGAALFGSRSSRFKTVEATATTLFAVMNGDEMRDTFMDLIYVMNGYVNQRQQVKHNV